MNKKGFNLFVIVLIVAYFMFGMIIYQFLKPVIIEQRDSDHMNCSSTDTDGDRVLCLILDGIIPITVIGILATAAGVLTNEVVR